MTEPKVAVFDLDGTITQRDTLIPFLRSLSTRRLARGLAGAIPSIALGVWIRDHRDQAKEAVIRSTFTGRSTEEIRTAADLFAEQLVPSGLISPTIDRITRHQVNGHMVIIASASPTALVLPIALQLGIESVIATELEIEDSTFTGRLIGANNRGDEKRRRVLAELEGPPNYAYGNLPDDGPLLSAALQAFVVKNGGITPFT